MLSAGCFPCPRCQEPWPNAGTTAPVGNFTVRLARLEAASLAGSTADAPDDATQEPSATQSPLNSRRFSNRIFTHYTIPSTAPIAAVVTVVQAVRPVRCPCPRLERSPLGPQIVASELFAAGRRTHPADSKTHPQLPLDQRIYLQSNATYYQGLPNGGWNHVS